MEQEEQWVHSYANMFCLPLTVRLVGCKSKPSSFENTGLCAY